MIQYVERLQKINSTIYCFNQSIEFSPAIAWWYNEKADDGLLLRGDTSLLALHIGIGANEFETYDKLNSCVKQLNNEFYSKGCYGGTSIFDYDALIYDALINTFW